MSDRVIHAIVLIQNWGDDNEILKIMRHNTHIISIFHILGRHSYLIDVNFDNKEQLSRWIAHMKSIKLSGGVPAVQILQTQKVIEVIKAKENFNISNYKNMKERHHFFIEIDNFHYDDELISLLKNSPIVSTVLHVQGDNSFSVEIIVDDYDVYKKFLLELKNITSINRFVTKEVISVSKYRNEVLDSEGNLVVPADDTREMYTL